MPVAGSVSWDSCIYCYTISLELLQQKDFLQICILRWWVEVFEDSRLNICIMTINFTLLITLQLTNLFFFISEGIIIVLSWQMQYTLYTHIYIYIIKWPWMHSSSCKLSFLFMDYGYSHRFLSIHSFLVCRLTSNVKCYGGIFQ